MNPAKLHYWGAGVTTPYTEDSYYVPFTGMIVDYASTSVAGVLGVVGEVRRIRANEFKVRIDQLG